MNFLRFALLLSALSACASPPPPEYAVYVAAFDRVDAASADAITIIEPLEKAARPPTDGEFIPDEAPYIADEGRPGVSLLLERGFKATANYNKVLAAYASGEAGQALKADVAAFGASTAALAVTAGLPQVGANATTAIAAVDKLADALLANADRAAFARAVEEHSGAIDAFLVEVRDVQIPSFFEVWNTQITEQRGALLRENRVDEAIKLGEDAKTFKKMLASWVLAIDEARSALAA